MKIVDKSFLHSEHNLADPLKKVKFHLGCQGSLTTSTSNYSEEIELLLRRHQMIQLSKRVTVEI